MDDDFKRFEMMRAMFVADKDIRLKMLLKGYSNKDIDAFFRGEKITTKFLVHTEEPPKPAEPAKSKSPIKPPKKIKDINKIEPETSSVNNSVPLERTTEQMDRYIMMKSLNVSERVIRERMMKNGMTLETIEKFFIDYPSTEQVAEHVEDHTEKQPSMSESSREGSERSSVRPYSNQGLDFSGFLAVLKNHLPEDAVREKMEAAGFSKHEIEEFIHPTSDPAPRLTKRISGGQDSLRDSSGTVLGSTYSHGSSRNSGNHGSHTSTSYRGPRSPIKSVALSRVTEEESSQGLHRTHDVIIGNIEAQPTSCLTSAPTFFKTTGNVSDTICISYRRTYVCAHTLYISSYNKTNYVRYF